MKFRVQSFVTEILQVGSSEFAETRAKFSH